MIKVSDLAKEFAIRGEKARALRNVSFEVEPGEFFTLLGPSGCGKSTTLRCIAGLEKPDGGTVEIRGRIVSSKGTFVPPSQRHIGMVFQNYAIWPHMTVFENVAFPLRHRNEYRDAERLRAEVLENLRVVQMEGYRDRDAPYLSGGQQQRVALARALVGAPDVLLLDEPLSNLDARLRIEMRDELRRICKQVGVTTLYVTHDQSEALALSDRIAVMHDGTVQQIGTPTEIYRRPASKAVASFVGDGNFIDVEAASSAVAGDELAVDSGWGPLRAIASRAFQPGDRATLMVRPEVLRVAPEGGRQEDWNHVAAIVRKAAFVGESIDCRVAIGTDEIAVRLPSYQDVEEGQPIQLRFRPAWGWVLPIED